MWPRRTHCHTWKQKRAEDWQRNGEQEWKGKDRGERSSRERILGQFRLPCVSHSTDMNTNTLTAIIIFYHASAKNGPRRSGKWCRSCRYMQRSQRVNTLPDIHAPLFKRQKGDGVRDEEWTRLCDCSDAWVAISAFSASTSPEGRGGGCGVGRALKETKEGGCRTESGFSKRKDSEPWRLLFDYIWLHRD